MFWKKQTKNKDNLLEVQTTTNPNAMKHDGNKDGIPDYLQRADIASMVKSNKDLNQWEVEVQKEIEEWIMGLDGREYNPQTNTYISTTPPSMNILGLKKLKNHIMMVSNKHAINNSLTKLELHQIALSQTLSLIDWFKYNYKKCEVSFSDLTPIITQFDNFTTLVLYRGMEDKQRWHTTQRTKLTGQVGSTKPDGAFPG